MTKHRSPTLITLGRLVRTFRDAAGVTQKGLASALGYTNGWVSNVENGQLRPRPEQVTALEQELGAPPGALMNVYEQLDGESLPGWFREWVDEEERAERHPDVPARPDSRPAPDRGVRACAAPR